MRIKDFFKSQNIQVIVAGLVVGIFVVFLFYFFGQKGKEQTILPPQPTKPFKEQLLDQLRGASSESQLREQEKEQMLGILNSSTKSQSQNLTPEDKGDILDSLSGSK